MRVTIQQTQHLEYKNMNLKHYILDENRQPKEAELLEWAEWFETNKARISKQTREGKYFISSVFLGLDHNWGDGEPILWETMVFEDIEPVEEEIFGKKYTRTHKDIFQKRYHTEHKMLLQHNELIWDIKQGKNIQNYNLDK